jgi:hypothetical protein
MASHNLIVTLTFAPMSYLHNNHIKSYTVKNNPKKISKILAQLIQTTNHQGLSAELFPFIILGVKQ